MGFSGFLGNDAVKNRLSGAVQSGKLSHSYLLCGPAGSGKKTLARLLAAAMQCTGEGERPCLVCPQCRKVMSGTHPDVIFVDDADKKTVSVSLARWAKEDLYIRPNEGRKKIYVVPRAQDMTTEAQNALLKVVEEPPSYGVFLLLSDRPERLLSTIRSRSVELMLSPVNRQEAAAFLREKHPGKTEEEILSAWEVAGGFLGQAQKMLRSGHMLDERALKLAEAMASGDRLAMAELLCKMEKLKRDQLIPILRQTQTLVGQALIAKAGRPAPEAAGGLSAGKTAARLRQDHDTLRRALEAAEANVGVGHICGFLAVRLR